MVKRCGSCEKEKDPLSFSKDSRSFDGLKYSCKECDRLRNKSRYTAKKSEILLKMKSSYESKKKKDPNFCANKNLKRRFGLSLMDKERLAGNQNFKCSICKCEFSNFRELCVDHCHETGKLRELLCRKCNTGLGNFSDRVDLLENAIRYLKKYGKF